MSPIAYLNREFITADQMSVSIADTGFVQGVTVAERLRTFGGKLFCAAQHFERLERSLQIVGVTGVDLNELAVATEQVTAHNYGLVSSGEDLGLTVFVSPGVAGANRPTVAVHSSGLPFSDWFRKYRDGERLWVSSIRQVPLNCWPAELKCRSRMHYFLAEQEVARLHPDGRALLLDQHGFVAEASTASVLMYRSGEGLIAPPPEKVLPSISANFLTRLAKELGAACVRRDFTAEDLVSADEVLLTSTSPCVLPVVAVNGQPVGSGAPGHFFDALLQRWSEQVGIDIGRQTTTHGSNGE